MIFIEKKSIYERGITMNYLIQTTELCKCYKETTALDHVSISIPEGAIYGLIGNNGAGKTTLMRILSQLQTPTSGSIHQKGHLKTGAIIETPALYPNLSACGNLTYQKKLFGASDTDIKKLLALVNLPNTKKPVRNYSLGMKQRLGLAMTLVGDPDFLILDEPLNGLDPEGIRDMRSIIVDLNQTYGKTIMISSHILGELQKIATDYGFLKSGKLIREFSSKEVLDNNLETFYFENFA